MGELRLRDSACNFHLAEDQLTLQANLDQAEFWLAGRPGLAGPRDLTWKVSGFDLGKLESTWGVTGLTANADLTGSSDVLHPLIVSLRIGNVALNGTDLGEVSADLELNNDRSFTQSARLSRGEGVLYLVTSGHLRKALPVTVHLEISQWQVDSSEMTSWGTPAAMPVPGSLPVRCVIEGTLDLRGRLLAAPNQPPALDGEGQLYLREATAGEWTLDPTTLPLQIRESALEIPALLLAIGRRGEDARFRLTVSAALALDRSYKISLRSIGTQDLASLLRIFVPKDLFMTPLPNGTIRLNVSGSGQLAEPELSAELQFEQIQYRDQPLGALRIDLPLREDACKGTGDAVGGALQLYGSTALGTGGAYRVSLDATSRELWPMLRLAGVSPAAMSMQITGNATVQCSPADLRSIQTQVFLPTLQVAMQGESFVNSEPISLTFGDGVLHLKSVSLGDIARRHTYFQIRDGRILIPLPTSPAALAQIAESARIASFEIVSESLPVGPLARLAGVAVPC